jgi:sigma-B regulation protein RsbU (phosphoserine phosphatase)
MALRGRLKFGLKTKILSILLGLALISLITSAYIAFSGMQKLRNSALRGHEQLGEQAIDESKKALIDEAEKNLLRSTIDQAAISNAIFDKLRDETAVMGQFASMLWNDPSSFKGRRSYSQKEEPDDIHSASVYMLAPGVSADAAQMDLDLSSNMDELFISIFGNNPELLSAVFIATPSGINRRYPWCSTYGPTFDPRERNWYERAVEIGEIGWSDVYVDASGLGLMVTCFQPVYNSLDELVSVVGADVTLKTISEEIINSPTDGYAFLLDSKGNVIVHEELSAEGRKWDEPFGFMKTLQGTAITSNLVSAFLPFRSKKIPVIPVRPNLLNDNDPKVRETAKMMIKGDAGSIRDTFGEDEIEEYITYAPIDSTNWHMGIVMPIKKIIAPALETEEEIARATKIQAEKINSQIGRAQRILFADFILIILVVSLIAYRLARRITRPILELDRGAKIIGSGDLEHKLEVETGDEIEELANTFNKMTDDLKLYIKNLQETTAAKEKIESELKVATEIQASMLPRIFPPFPDRKEFSIYATMDPAKQVGGDFYDFFIIGGKKLCFLIGDVSGKGVPAALFMVISKTLLKTEGLRGHSPNEMLCRVNNMLCPDNDASMFVTLFCVILDLETGEVEYANGGHNPPLICSGDGCFEFMDISRNFVVGPMPDTEYQSVKSTLNPGDIVFLYTDGVTEAMNPEHQQFSEERLREYLSSLSAKTPKDIIHAARAEIKAFARGAPQSDDITMLALKFNGQQ